MWHWLFDGNDARRTASIWCDIAGVGDGQAGSQGGFCRCLWLLPFPFVLPHESSAATDWMYVCRLKLRPWQVEAHDEPFRYKIGFIPVCYPCWYIAITVVHLQVATFEMIVQTEVDKSYKAGQVYWERQNPSKDVVKKADCGNGEELLCRDFVGALKLADESTLNFRVDVVRAETRGRWKPGRGVHETW